MLDTREVAALLQEYGQRASLRGGNPYRARAYRKAAENLGALTEPLAEVIRKGELRTIPGVGDAIADIISTLAKKGTHPSLEKLRRETPEGLVSLLSLPGLRVRDAVRLKDRLGIDSLEALEQAARDNRIATTKGLGSALHRKVINALEIKQQSKGKRHIHRAAALLEAAKTRLERTQPQLSDVTLAGDLRRGCELVSDMRLVAIGSANIVGPVQHSDVKLVVTPRKQFGSALLYATGSASHLAKLEHLARARGMTLSEKGLRRGGRPIAASTEADIYKALGLQYIEPELREGADEIDLAARRKIPSLVRDQDIRGILHSHTDRSDGVNTLEQMAKAVFERGYEYFGVADHSRSAHYAGGLSLPEISAQHREIAGLNKSASSSFRIFHGIESDILRDGSLDYPPSILRKFDFVVASVHSQFRLDRKQQTERIIRAVSNPFTTILGHLTGRQLLRRPGYEVDVEKVLKACARFGVAVEINANPWRLDLDWRWHQMALHLGCMMSINPDAHSTSEIDLTHWGVELARKGRVSKSRVLNCLPLGEFRKHLAQRKAQ